MVPTMRYGSKLKGIYKDVMSLRACAGATLEKPPRALLYSGNGRATHNVGIRIAIREDPLPLCMLDISY